MDSDEKLVGVISLCHLIVLQLERIIAEFRISKVHCMKLDADVEEVAHKFERYRLLALPVVDEEARSQGIIAIDDTLEQLRPPDWQHPPAGIQNEKSGN